MQKMIMSMTKTRNASFELLTIFTKLTIKTSII